jgi:hypothetical protein
VAFFKGGAPKANCRDLAEITLARSNLVILFKKTPKKNRIPLSNKEKQDLKTILRAFE